MPRQRKDKSSSKAKSSNVDRISEEEQWRIINNSGVLKNIPKDTKVVETEDDTTDDEICSPLCNEIFNAILLIIPFSSLYITMDVLAHRQYAQKYTPAHLLQEIIWRIPILSLCIFFTLRYKKDRRMQALLFLLSVACGSRLIYVVNRANWGTVMKQCPPLGTIWVYTIVQLELPPAVAALGLVAGYVKWKDLRIIFD